MEKVIGSSALLLIFLVTSGYAQDQPEITERILPEIKRLGTSGYLNCTVIYQGRNQLHWIQKQTRLLISRDERIEIPEQMNRVDIGWFKYEVSRRDVGDKRIYTLAINRLERKDAGLYTCQVRQIGGEYIASKDGDMVVVYPPSIYQAQTVNTISVREGKTVNLTCEAEGYPKPNITWVRVSGASLSNGKLRQKSNVFTIENARAEDRGIYRCIADNTVRPPAWFDSTLYVFFKPIARAIQSSYGQAQNRMFDITIECRVAGWPEPDLQWYKQLDGGNLRPINNDEDYAVNILLNHAMILDSQERWFQLVVYAVTANDYGEYICEGANDYGFGRASITLFETSECQGANCPNEGYRQTFSNAHVSLASTLLIGSLLLILKTMEM